MVPVWPGVRERGKFGGTVVGTPPESCPWEEPWVSASPPLCPSHAWSLAGSWALYRRSGKSLAPLLLLPLAICPMSWSYSRNFSFHNLHRFFLWKVILAWAVCLEGNNPVPLPLADCDRWSPWAKGSQQGASLWETLPDLGVPCWLGVAWFSQNLPGAGGRWNGDREMDSSRKGPEPPPWVLPLRGDPGNPSQLAAERFPVPPDSWVSKKTSTCQGHAKLQVKTFIESLLCVNNFIFIFKNFSLFLTVLGLRCCVGFSVVGVSRGYSLVGVCRLLIAVASLVVEPRL